MPIQELLAIFADEHKYLESGPVLAEKPFTRWKAVTTGRQGGDLRERGYKSLFDESNPMGPTNELLHYLKKLIVSAAVNGRLRLRD